MYKKTAENNDRLVIKGFIKKIDPSGMEILVPQFDFPPVVLKGYDVESYGNNHLQRLRMRMIKGRGRGNS